MFVVARNPKPSGTAPETQLPFSASPALARLPTAPRCFAPPGRACAKARLDIFSLHGLPPLQPRMKWRARAGSVRAAFGHETTDGVIMSRRVQSRHVRRPEERARLGIPALWMFGAEGKPVLTMRPRPLHWRRARAAANERDDSHRSGASCASAQIVIGGVHEKVSDGRLVDEATLRALRRQGRDLEEIRAARFVRAAA